MSKAGIRGLFVALGLGACAPIVTAPHPLRVDTPAGNTFVGDCDGFSGTCTGTITGPSGRVSGVTITDPSAVAAAPPVGYPVEAACPWGTLPSITIFGAPSCVAPPPVFFDGPRFGRPFPFGEPHRSRREFDGRREFEGRREFRPRRLEY